MVMSAYASLAIHEWRNLRRCKMVSDDIGAEPSRAGMDDLTYYMSGAYQDFRRKFMKSSAFSESFEKKIGPSLVAPEVAGNSYAASEFLGLNSIFENDGTDLAGKRVILCGHGSGSHAMIQANIVPEGYRKAARQFDLMKRLASRKKLSIRDYERIHGVEIPPEEWSDKARRRFVVKSIGARETGITSSRIEGSILSLRR